jgi:hypothetical protein
MDQHFPEGCKVTLVGTVVVDVRKANLVKQWTACLLHKNVGMYPPAIADNVVPYNVRLNDTMDQIHDWIDRCASGMTVYDASKIDRREMAGRILSPGVFNGLKRRGCKETSHSRTRSTNSSLTSTLKSSPTPTCSSTWPR